MPYFHQSVVILGRFSFFLAHGTQSMEPSDGIEYFRMEIEKKLNDVLDRDCKFMRL